MQNLKPTQFSAVADDPLAVSDVWDRVAAIGATRRSLVRNNSTPSLGKRGLNGPGKDGAAGLRLDCERHFKRRRHATTGSRSKAK